MNIDLQDVWKRNGFLLVKGLFSPEEVTGLQSWVQEIADWPVDATRWMHHHEETASGPKLARTENFIPFHDGLRSLLTAGTLNETLADLFGEPVVVYKEKINYKFPGGGGYAAHQDAPAYEFVKDHITCSIPVDRATVENGCLFFSPGLHGQGLIDLDERGCIGEETAAEMEWIPCPAEPGDVLFFSSYAPHYSPPNKSAEPRRSIYVTYNAISAGDFREAYYADKRQALAAADAQGDTKSARISKIAHFQGTIIKNGEQT